MSSIPQKIAILIAFVLVAACVVGLYLCIQDAAQVQAWLVSKLSAVPESLVRKIALGIAAAVLAWVGILLFMALFGIRLSGPRQFRIPGDIGSTIISLDAVEDFLNRCGAKVGGVKDLRVRVSSSRKGMVVTGYANLDLTQNIPDFADHFHQLIRKELSDRLGIVHVADVCIQIRKFTEIPPSSAALVTPKSQAAPFPAETVAPAEEPYSETGWRSESEGESYAPAESHPEENLTPYAYAQSEETEEESRETETYYASASADSETSEETTYGTEPAEGEETESERDQPQSQHPWNRSQS